MARPTPYSVTRFVHNVHIWANFLMLFVNKMQWKLIPKNFPEIFAIPIKVVQFFEPFWDTSSHIFALKSLVTLHPFSTENCIFYWHDSLWVGTRTDCKLELFELSSQWPLLLAKITIISWVQKAMKIQNSSYIVRFASWLLISLHKILFSRLKEYFR